MISTHNGVEYQYYNNNSIGGFVSTRKNKSQCHLHSLEVPIDLRNRGLGQKMLKELLWALEQEGISKVDLFVKTDNLIAIHLYKKLGFVIKEEMGKIDGNFHICTCFLMEKDLKCRMQ